MSEVEAILEETVPQLKALRTAYSLAEWEAATTGTPEANRQNQAAQAALMRFLADPRRYAALKRLYEAGGAADPLLARQLKLLYLQAAENQQDEAAIERLTQLEAAVRDRYYNFRGVVGGRAQSDNELDNLLANSTNTAVAREAWEASKQVGGEVAGLVRELARTRNAAAQRQGFRDHFHRALELGEIEEQYLLSLFKHLERATDEPFARLKASLDEALARRFALPAGALGPWHYGDRFFQKPPSVGEVNFDGLFAGKDPVALALATYDGLGLEVRDILERSDLYARPGKNQHAFCTDIDKEGDVRTLNNLEPTHRWNETLLHELGHAVYDKYQDRGLPWLLRGYPHVLSTEAIAILLGSLSNDQEWLTTIVGVPAAEAERVARAAQAFARANALIFSRWVLVMTHFERGLYAHPDGDLDSLWWDLVERYQGLRRPGDRRAPDWAAKIHIALYPVYYHNYELGNLVAAQLRHCLDQAAGGLTGRSGAGRWLVEHYFWPGNRQAWPEHITAATGEPLNPDYFVRALDG
ncbi:MAG: M2 family metallopeptidase [Anaerolineales bacterium]|nr:M2 family metallopeptidase [Anaerolineales bacterium]